MITLKKTALFIVEILIIKFYIGKFIGFRKVKSLIKSEFQILLIFIENLKVAWILKENLNFLFSNLT